MPAIATNKKYVITSAISLISIFLLISWFFPAFQQTTSNFLYNFFAAPLGRGYNPVNSTVYAVTLVAAIWSIARLLTILKIKADGRFILSVTPFIVMGSALRALKDAHILTSTLFVTPLIYFVVFGYTITCLLISLFFKRRDERFFYLLFTTLGVIPATYLFSEVASNIVEIEIIVYIILYTFMASIIALPAILAINRFYGFRNIPLSFGIVVAHFLDASATHVGVTRYGYYEQHFLTRFLTLSFDTTLALFPLKFLAVVIAILALERFIKESQTCSLSRLTLLILGLAPGMRDLFRLAMLT